MAAKRRATVGSSSSRSVEVRNRLLTALPKADLERLLPDLEIVPLKLKDFLHKPGEQIRHVYFPDGGFCSVVAVLEDGDMIEVATIGREGAVGTTAALSGMPTSSAVLVQGETATCYRMAADAFRREMSRQ